MIRGKIAATLLAALAALAVSVAATAGPAAAAPRSSQDSQWAQVAAGWENTCAVRTDATLWCWGNNEYGNLGIGRQTTQSLLPQQVTTPAAGGWTSVTVGNDYACALRADHTLWCWGLNAVGELGIHSHIYAVAVPHQVTTRASAGGWTSVSAGGNHTCATRIGGSLWCWGDNAAGDLGIGNSNIQDVPRQVTSPAVTGWASVAAGNIQTCALRTGGTLWCWGDNSYGELGLGNESSQSLPQQVTTPAAAGWASVSGSGYQTCATRIDGSLWCWGDNNYGQLGLGNRTGEDLPQQVTTPAAGWASVADGFWYTCALGAARSLWCWGDNGFGQLGIGHHPDQNQPYQVTTPGPHQWASLSTNGWHTCAIRVGGTLWCWGENAYGVLGIGNRPEQFRPQQVTVPTAPGPSPRGAG